MVKGLAGVAVLCALALAGPAGAVAATIAGTVSDQNTHAGIGGIQVCPTPQPYEFEAECTYTDASGHYSLTGLRPFSYKLYFSGWQNNLRYVSEYYNDKASFGEADLVTLGSPEETRQIDVGLAEGGTIAGTVSDDVTKAPIEGLAACAEGVGSSYQRCAKSDVGGHYEINGLPSGGYRVYYESWNQVNYIRGFYKDVEGFGEAKTVEVTAPNTTSPIDDELARGAEILGHVSEVTSGGPVEDAMVCAPPISEESIDENCDWTDAAGDYAIRGLRAGTYQVAFEVETGPFGVHAFEWWQGASAREQATPLVLSTPSSTTGIDGRASRPYEPPATTVPATTGPVVPIIRTTGGKPLPKCRKGFHRKLVKGKKRCVRKKHRHPRRHAH